MMLLLLMEEKNSLGLYETDGTCDPSRHCHWAGAPGDELDIYDNLPQSWKS